MNLRIKTNVREFSRFLTRYERRQLPFAISRAINATAFDVRAQVVKRTFPEAFKLRNRSFPRAIFRVDKSSKRDLAASVFDRKQLDYLPRHEEGGIKRPRSGAKLAVPKGARRTGRGVAKADRPRQAIASGRAYINKRRSAIFRKLRGNKLRLLHILVPSVRIRARLDFTRDAERVVDRRFKRHFARSLIKALRTAR